MIDHELLNQFVLEATEHSEGLEKTLLALERDREDAALVHQAFQHIHAIKGTSDYTKLNSINRLSHAMEDLLVRLRDQTLSATGTLVDTLLEGSDLLRDCIGHVDDPDFRSGDIARYVGDLDSAEQDAPARRAAPRAAALDQPADLVDAFCKSGEQHVNALRLAVAKLREGGDPSGAVGILRRTIRVFHGSARYLGARELSDLLVQLRDASEANDAPGEKEIAALDSAVNHVEQALQMLAAPEPLHTPATNQSLATEPDVDNDAQVLRVSLSKLDNIVNLASDLVVVQNSLDHAVTNAEREGWIERNVGAVRTASRQLAKLTTALQTQAMSVRLVPVRRLFERFRRIVRDLARSEGKEVALVILGGDTDLDKGVSDLLRDPLLHLVRNAVAHGLETPQERRAADKSAQGVITLKAVHEGSHISVEVVDDGRGIDPARVRAAAQRLDITSATEIDRMDDRELVDLIFRPGVSTIQVADGLAGRGVGLDAALANIKRIGGTISVDWEPGAGSSFRLELPLSLAIMEVMIVRAAGQRFAISSTYIEQGIQVERHRTTVVGSVEAIVHQNQPIPLRALGELIDIDENNSAPQSSSDARTALLLHHQGRRLGLVVDEIVAQHDVLVRPLPAALRRLNRFSGATVMGDGDLVLILNPPWLFARREA
jgi:two-component system, chemotaxis family, sensor kinase CheA